MAWRFRFETKECDSISINVDNRHWRTWHASDGNCEWEGADWFRDKENIHVYGAVSPRGKNGWFMVKWDGEDKQKFSFDEDEDHDVER